VPRATPDYEKCTASEKEGRFYKRDARGGLYPCNVWWGRLERKGCEGGRGTGVKGKGEVRVTGVQGTRTLEGGLYT